MSEAASEGFDAPRGFDRLAEAFDTLGIAPQTVEHEAAFTVDSARELRGTIAGLHIKNLFLKDKKGTMFLVVAPEEKPVDLKRLHGVIGAKGRLSFGSADAMARYLGVTPGSVTPLALINDVEGAVSCVVDTALTEAQIVNAHPLRNTATTSLSVDGFFAVLDHIGHTPQIVALPEPDATE